jgi:hypothetical protein
MRERLRARDVISDRARFIRYREHLFGRRVEEPGFLIDKATDQPGTGDAIDLRAFARHPLTRRRTGLTPCRQALLDPGAEPAFQISCVDPVCPQCRRSFLANFVAMGAIDDDRTAGRQLAAPRDDLARIAPLGAHQDANVGIEGRFEDDRRRCGADRAVQVPRRDRNWLLSVHACALLASREAQSLDGEPSDGGSAGPRIAKT